ncbi:kinase-regulated stress-responsive transcription factor skn7 [Cyanidiococcus yangmingshanensis]|uniref:Kinase-regulated stress-responsive transcription factor skn7 n=1 Tax=Cyanidiococcus yangmingshanensis TaxID=2690220 RepID=A0A7J7IPA8_9RHOD|nr:kinase-regulated stress-responsive transcription factor skn7 [Cyanidiococcus yangmingshanensis]
MVSAETSNKLSASIAMDNDKPQTTVFIQKVYDLVQDSETSDTVNWEESGDSFVIWRVGDFTEKVLPAYFKHSNMSSFVRQLNQYGFHKISHERWEFQHDFFKRDRPDLLSQIKRNRPERRKRTLTVTSGGGSSSSAFYGGSSGSVRGPRTLPAAVATKLRPDAGAAYIQQHVNVPLAASQLLSEEDMNSFDASGSGDQRKPLWLSRLFGRGNKTIEIGKYGSLEDEAVRLRRDNSLLLQELSELRRLYARLEQRLMESEQRETEREEQFRHLQGFMLRIFSSVEIMNSQLANAGLDFLALDQEWTQALTYLAEHADLPNQTDSNFCQVGAASGRLIHDADPLELLRSDGAPPEGVSLSNITSDSVGREVPQTTVADAYSSIQQSGTTDKELESLQERMQSMYQQESAGTQGFEMMLEQQRAAASRAAPELTPGAQGVRILSDDVLLPASTDSPGTV